MAKPSVNILSGTIEIDSGEIQKTNKKDLRIGYVRQNFRASLFPWLSITGNMSFPLKIQGMSSSERKEKVERLIKNFGIEINLKKENL